MTSFMWNAGEDKKENKSIIIFIYFKSLPPIFVLIRNRKSYF